MDCFAGDLCALSELSDSALLKCIQHRHKKGLTQTYVGQVLLCVRPEHPLLSTEPRHIHSLASRVLRTAVFHREDHTIVLYGCHGSGKTFLSKQLLVTLLAGLNKHPNSTRVAEGSQLLSLLTQCRGEERNQSLMSVKLSVQHKQLAGCHFSCLLLDPENLQQFKVFHMIRNSDDMRVENKLESIGLPEPLRVEFMNLLLAIHTLCLDADPVKLSNLLGISGEDIDDVIAGGHTLAEQIYSYLVRWMVSWLNTKLGASVEESKLCCSVTIVDPPGTCTHAHGSGSHHDSLHHLMTRYITEILHNIFCLRLFVWEQEQYIEEGIEWEFVDVLFNQPLVDTFHRPTGLLISAGMPSMEEVTEAIHMCCERSANTCFTTEASTFAVTHFNGECSYRVDEQWVASNTKVTAVEDGSRLMQVLLSSSNQLLTQIVESFSLSSPDVLPGKNSDARTLTERAREGMAVLSEVITTSQPHFVLCLAPVPFDSNKECSFDDEFVLSQLQHLRVLDTALIQSCGYPTRIDHCIFAKKYSDLLLNGLVNVYDGVKCKAILEKCALQDFHIGKSQVLLKPWHLHQLDDLLENFQNSARKIQQAFRRTLRKKSDQLQMMKLTFHSIPEEDSGESHSDSEETHVIFSPNRKLLLSSTSSSELENRSMSTRTVPPTPPPRPVHTLSEPLLPMFSITSTKKTPVNNGYSNQIIQHSSEHEEVKAPGSPSRSLPKTKVRKKPSWGKSTQQAVGSPPRSRPTSSEALKQPWNHGKTSRENAELHLKAVPTDCYLVRESENRVGEYSLSVKHSGIIKHFRIDTKRASHIRYELFGAQRSFPSLSELVEYYSQHCITKDGELLTVPCMLEGSGLDGAPPLPPRKKNLSMIRRTKPPALQPPPIEPQNLIRPPMIRANTTDVESFQPNNSEFLFDLSDESIALLRKELDIEERIVEAARRMLDMPSASRKDKQRRKHSLQQSQSRLLSLRKQYHELQDRRRFLETTMQNINFSTLPNRRISEPTPPTPPPRPVIF